MADLQQLIDDALGGKRPAQARLLSAIERADENLLTIEQALAPHVGKALVVGITGPPGAGKSTLINRLIPYALQTFGRAAILAVDPSSPFSDGALLGDRVRMQAGELGENVFIRSMASRGEEGGMAQATAGAVRLFDACGWPLIIIETLGIGQVELDVMNLADTVVVVLNPGWGDEIQANKAGLTEAGDVFAINKADKPGAQQTCSDLEESVALSTTRPTPAIVATTATVDEGVDALWQAINAHQTALVETDELEKRRAQRHETMARRIIAANLEERMNQVLAEPTSLALLQQVCAGHVSYSEAAEKIMANMSKH
ncbi:MAG: methylmalonyl Co-A mutase-associated GTPase MeaB [Halioglobus sp.]